MVNTSVYWLAISQFVPDQFFLESTGFEGLYDVSVLFVIPSDGEIK